MNYITPWSPYLARTSLSSAGRIALTAAFADVINVRSDFEARDLPEIFCAPADDGENDACRDLVRLNVEHTAEQFIRGRILTFARPLEGGIITQLDPGLWEIDDPVMRFATGAFNLDQWSHPNARLTHRLFVDSVSFDRWLTLQRPTGELSSRQIEAIINPQVRAARSCRAADSGYTFNQASFDETRPTSCSNYRVDDRIETIDLAEVKRRTNLSRSTIYAHMGKGEFPQRFHLTNNRVVWSSSEVNKWVNEKASVRHDC